ncbi:iron chelate uptake ABC transporter family permease subunit, partial [Wenyingzhuangia sp. 1_MG-2023]|nr:iron chelate uptake ABC transporter family permease subunit [Wenyingzhuangia sp. 1_MG-2023]
RSSEQLLLGGVAISLMLGSLTHFILFIGEPFAANKVLFWLMGSLGRVESSQLWLLFPVVLVSSGVLLLLGRHFDAMLLGDDNARTLGVDAVRLRALALVICAALTAAVVAYCGGIGFVGLMIPH